RRRCRHHQQTAVRVAGQIAVPRVHHRRRHDRRAARSARRFLSAGTQNVARHHAHVVGTGRADVARIRSPVPAALGDRRGRAAARDRNPPPAVAHVEAGYRGITTKPLAFDIAMKKTLGLMAIVTLLLSCGANADAVNKAIPAPEVDTPAAEVTGPQVAVLAGGCFWGLQGMFEHVQGVTRVVAGYSGGDKSTAHYEMVGTETTGHAESVQITFDPKQISYGQLLRLFFSVAHD